jgi:hypothetical protein
MLPHKNTKQERQEYSSRTPIDYHKDTKSSSKTSLLLLKRVVAIWQQYYKRGNGERARESEEKIGQHGVAMKSYAKRGGKRFLLRGRRKRDPPCMLSKWHSGKSWAPLRGVHHRERGTHFRRGIK